MTNPENIVRIHSRNGGFGSIYEGNMWAQPYTMGILAGDAVEASTTPDLNVRIGGTPTSPAVVIGENANGYKIALDIVGKKVVALTPPASNYRYASIVAYTDDLSLPSKDKTTTGSPSSCGLIVVYGGSTSRPRPASDADIRAAITRDGAAGTQAVYGVLCDIKLGQTTTSITTPMIEKRVAAIGREQIQPRAISDSRIATDTIPNRCIKNNAITADKIDFTTFHHLTRSPSRDISIGTSGGTVVSANELIVGHKYLATFFCNLNCGHNGKQIWAKVQCGDSSAIQYRDNHDGGWWDIIPVQMLFTATKTTITASAGTDRETITANPRSTLTVIDLGRA